LHLGNSNRADVVSVGYFTTGEATKATLNVTSYRSRAYSSELPRQALSVSVQEGVDRLALLSSGVSRAETISSFPQYQETRHRRGDAPGVKAIFWKIAMRYAVELQRPELNDLVKDFHALCQAHRGNLVPNVCAAMGISADGCHSGNDFLDGRSISR